MKKSNKKGFTIVELVIVIAVISILSAVLIPTFTSITEKAKKSNSLQAARSALTNVIAEEGENFGGDYIIKSGDYYFDVDNGQFDEESGTKTAPNQPINAQAYFAGTAGTYDTNGATDGGIINATVIEDLGDVIVYKLA